MEICGKYGILPNSCIILESKVQKLGDSPISSGGFSGVWKGIYEERPVAIKVLRQHTTITKVLRSILPTQST